MMSGLILLGLRILAAIALYGFLGWALFLFWHTLRQQASEIAARQVTPLELLITAPEEEPSRTRFTSRDIVIGRESDCECRLNHVTVSARHARLAFHHQQWWLDDLQSKNGTKLNGEPLLTPTVIVNGDEITCGETHLAVILISAGHPETGENS